MMKYFLAGVLFFAMIASSYACTISANTTFCDSFILRSAQGDAELILRPSAQVAGTFCDKSFGEESLEPGDRVTLHTTCNVRAVPFGTYELKTQMVLNNKEETVTSSFPENIKQDYKGKLFFSSSWALLGALLSALCSSFIKKRWIPVTLSVLFVGAYVVLVTAPFNLILS
ncbi:MAG: hypothetical protein H6502_03605 [Candidatus Woesearchaeota archaeon]|nr:MAG: hypothetical protein H6502_03605 [Candidatus Woesearchaeota archaeon]